MKEKFQNQRKPTDYFVSVFWVFEKFLIFQNQRKTKDNSAQSNRLNYIALLGLLTQTIWFFWVFEKIKIFSKHLNITRCSQTYIIGWYNEEFKASAFGSNGKST